MSQGARHWSDSAAALNELSAQYVLGTLQGRARRRFETVMAGRPDIAERVADWEARLHRMGRALPPVAPSPGLWTQLAQRAGLPAGAPSLMQRLGAFARQWLGPVPAGALAFGLLAGVLVPQLIERPAADPELATELPDSYVGVLARPDGKPGLIVASLRHGRVVDLEQVSPVTPAPGQTLYLWTIDGQGAATGVGPIPHGPFVQAPLADTAENLFRTAVELGVTLEAAGIVPVQPAGEWVYRGLCGKVWRAPAR